MPAIIKEPNEKWIVRGTNENGVDVEFSFNTHAEAQQKANELMFAEARRKGLL